MKRENIPWVKCGWTHPNKYQIVIILTVQPYRCKERCCCILRNFNVMKKWNQIQQTSHVRSPKITNNSIHFQLFTMNWPNFRCFSRVLALSLSLINENDWWDWINDQNRFRRSWNPVKVITPQKWSIKIKLYGQSKGACVRWCDRTKERDRRRKRNRSITQYVSIESKPQFMQNADCFT